MSAPLSSALMLAGYLLVMGYLGAGLYIRRRAPRGGPRPVTRPGWPGLLRRVLGTVTGGYLLLMAVVIGYYHGVERLGGPFLTSAFTGTATLLGITLPLYVLASWAETRRARRHAGCSERR